MDEIIKLLGTIGPTAGAIVAVLYFYLAKRNDSGNGRDYASMLQFMQHLQTRVAALEDQLRVYVLYSARLMAQIVGLGGTPIDMHEVEREQRGVVAALARDDKRMAAVLGDGFDASEIAALAFDLQVPDGALGDGSAELRGIKLVTWCRRRGVSENLAKLLIRMRPNIAV